MVQNSFVLDEINREVMKMQADTHLQKSLPSKGIPLKTTRAFLKIFWELYSATVYFKAYLHELIFLVSKIF